MTDWFSRPQAVGTSHWAFPPASKWPDDDVVGVGGDLDPATLIAAYRQGVFPMALQAPDPLVGWWSPDPRGIVPLDNLRVTRSMRRSAKRYAVRINTCFADIIRACGNPARANAWITEEFVEAFVRLHQLGWAHSVEVFNQQGGLAGGLYGVRINGLFAGESMFHLERDASKVALMALVQLMRDSRMTLLDVQWRTEHLGSLGAIEISRAQYLALLADALETAQVG
jgi:leucyl/phenylalanyl-tRNA--protein transferase